VRNSFAYPPPSSRSERPLLQLLHGNCNSIRAGTTTSGQKKEKAPERRARKHANKEIHQQVKYVRFDAPRLSNLQSAWDERSWVLDAACLGSMMMARPKPLDDLKLATHSGCNGFALHCGPGKRH